MISRLSWTLDQLNGRLWVRATLYGIIAVVTALAAIFLKNFIPESWTQQIGADAVDSILNILAASMLSVTIFSMGAIVAAYSAASNSATPRATSLLIEDSTSQKALSTFIGAFIFSMVGIIALHTGAYGESGRLILFVVTIGVIVMMVVTLLRWIQYLTRLGRSGETITRVEKAARDALEGRLQTPYLGGQAFTPETPLPDGTHAIYDDIVGYVQYIDMARLQHLADKHDVTVYVLAPPGKFINPACPIAAVHGLKPEEQDDEHTAIIRAFRSAFITGEERAFRQDPRFGVVVLCEIATRGLSPATNDSGTPIQIIGIGVRILSLWAKRDALAAEDSQDIRFPRVYMPPLRIADLFDDFFTPIARDSAGLLEVAIRLQKAYLALAATGDESLIALCRRHAALSLKRNKAALSLPEDYDRIAAIAAPLLADDGTPPPAC